MLKYQLILFDMDGTTANTDELVVETMNELYDKYHNGHRRPKEEVYYFSGPPIKETLSHEFPELDVDELAKEFASRSKAKYDTIVTGYPHCRETLLKLKECGARLAIVTSKQHDMAIYCLKIIHLDDVMDFIIGLNDVTQGKPSPEGINKAIEKEGLLDKSKVLYVGDNLVDYQAAYNAGVDSCLVTWGPRKMSPLASPTYKIDDYYDLLEVCIDEN